MLIIGTAVVAVVVVAAWSLLTTGPNATSSATLDDQTLEAKALEWARDYGLQETPLAKRAVRMTLGQWLAFSGGQLEPGATQLFGIDQDTPVFVLAIRGNVAWRGLVGGLGEQRPSEQFNNITMVVYARNGHLVAATAARNLSDMPIQVPLNTLTPAPPINFAPTRPPVTPPTLAPKATLTPTPMQSVLATPTRSH